jgi:hypothetical protein
MKEYIQEIYDFGLEKFAGDETLAKEFTSAFVKEAFMSPSFGAKAMEGAGVALGGGAMGLALGLGIHGMSNALQGVGTGFLRDKFRTSLNSAIASNPLLHDADKIKINSYAETVFKFAPHVACDTNLLSSILANAVQGEGLDPTTIHALADLEGRVTESRKNALFSPKAYK